jgi:hypothetical protein
MGHTTTRRPLRLNTDGRAHPRENALALLTLLLGLIALGLGALGMIASVDRTVHTVAAAAGVLGVVIGLIDQYLSATTGERWVIIPGVIMSAVGLAFALSQGAFPGS